MNSINVIAPYVFETQWVFDDPSKELVREPFVSGTDNMIDMLTTCIPNAEDGFILVFSAQPFPDHDTVLVWIREEHNGNWYYEEDTGILGWLCPALLKYFDKAPGRIYVQIKAKGLDL